jgi:nucleotide-binding universal stress UspA family protein
VTPIFEESSNVTRAVLRIVDERKCDLIVMSTRGRSSAASILLGSETAQTLMESRVPVLAVKHRGAFMNLFQVLSSSEVWLKSGPKTN